GEALLFARAIDEVLDEHGDVIPPLAEGRDDDRHHVEAEEEVVTEPPGLDLPFELLVGGGDDTDIDLDRALAADGGDEPLLQDAEDLRLRGRTHIADLVEEEGPAVGELELPGPVGEGPREGPLHMPEEFALDELRGDRRAVDLDEGAVGARRESVDGTGDEFLAGAVLPGDQDPRVGWAD